MLMELFNFDTKSLIGILVWGNIATGFIVYLYQTFNHYPSNRDIFRNMTMIRFMSAVGYLLMFFRGGIHDILSVNICNSLLFLCHYMEALLILELASISSKKMRTALTVIFAVDIFAFNAVEYFFRNPSLRICVASIIIFSIFILPTVRLMVSKKASPFKKSISAFYLLLLIALIPRCLESFLYRNVTILSNNYYQTLMFISLILLMICNTIVYLLFMKEQNDSLIEKLATIDNLTGLLNRHSFFMQGKPAFERLKATRTELSLLFFDIDHFKVANDQYGHQFGDEVLVRFADILKTSIRPNDLCCRYGGEEFIVLLMNVNQNISQSIATRVLEKLEACAFPAHPDFHITASVGSVAGVPQSGELLEDYIRMGDEALYQAKEAGRNKSVSYHDLNR